MCEESPFKLGMHSELTKTVTANDLAATYGSGLLEVFATPALVALMEQTAVQTVEQYMPQGCTTVGSAIDVQHLKATPCGGTVTCRCTLTAIDNRRLTFEIEANDEKGLIGKAVHTRHIINTERFLSKLK